MTSREIATVKNESGEWEVRRNDDEQTLLGTFSDSFCRDLFVEAVLGVIGVTDYNTAGVAAHSRKNKSPELAAA